MDVKRKCALISHLTSPLLKLPLLLDRGTLPMLYMGLCRNISLKCLLARKSPGLM